MDQTSGHTRAGSSWIAAGVVVAVFYLAALPLIFSGRLPGRAGVDQINYHEPTVRQFAAEWPRPDLRDYLSATTPGYHLFLSVLVRAGMESRAGLQLAGSLFSAGLLGVLAWTCAARAGSVQGIVLTLPVMCSMYVFMPGVWLQPDGAGWLGVLLVLLLALRERFDALTVLGGAVLMAALVTFRQIHLWTAGALWASAWLGPGPAGGRLSDLFGGLPVRVRRAALMFAGTLPALVIVWLFVRMWGGLTPPRFQQQYRGVNPAAGAFILSLVGGFSIFYSGWIWRQALVALREARITLALAACAGVAAALFPETTRDVQEGRFSGLWNLVGKLPVVAGRTSPLIVALSALGALALVVWCRALAARDRWILLAALAGFTAAQMASFELYQRYNEPMVLMLLAIMAGRVRHEPAPEALTGHALSRLPSYLVTRLAPVGALALLLAAVTTWKIATEPEASISDDLPGRTRAGQGLPG